LLCYGIFSVAAIFSQPYALFVSLAHLVWSSWYAFRDRNPAATHVCTTAVAALLCFMPWYCWTKASWGASITTQHLSPGISFRSPLLIAREISGAGYFGSALLLGTAVLGLRRVKSRRWSSFLVLTAVIPVVVALAIDSWTGYFFAIRQIIFVLTPICILSAFGINSAIESSAHVGWSLFAATVCILAIADVRLFQKPRENWESAAQILNHETTGGSCVIFVPAESAYLYKLIRPSLPDRQCGVTSVPLNSIAIAISPYSSPRDVSRVLSPLYATGWRRARSRNAVGPEVLVLNR
jgi:uncharacterized membrane protein YhaH (DUF805 family)